MEAWLVFALGLALGVLAGLAVGSFLRVRADRREATAFRAAAAEALHEAQASFLALAEQRLNAQQAAARGELEARRQAVEALIKPIGEALRRLDERVGREWGEVRAGLAEQLRGLAAAQDALRQETGRLVSALRRPEVRGRWGEVQLKRAVELAGMLPHCDFEEQRAVAGGQQRPDLIVHLPGGKTVVVDAKAPLAAYLDALEAADEAARRTALQRYVQHVRTHVQALAAKAYWQRLQPAPEFVVLFLPGEAFFSAALTEAPELMEEAARHNVILTGPTGLIALLKAAHHGWREAALEDNARAVSALGAELYARLAKLAEHWAAAGRALAQATEAYNRATGSLEARVLVSARRLAELHAAPAGQPLPELSPVEVSPRSPQAPELTSPP
ncbi:MAG: DNA recombination protein RmuC [Thiobacillaceae bacterium]|nr:DNA recombination protein RmuC [Thiobacillaceae bacterium]